MEYGHCSPTVRADFRSGVLRRLRRLGQVCECDDVVVVTACGFVEGSTARDDPESGVVDVAIYDVGGKVLFGEVFDTGSGEHCATSVFAGDDDVGSCFEIPQIEEDPVGALPVDVAGDDCRSDLTGCGSAGVPPCVLPIRWDLECSIGIESEIDDVGVDADGRDFEARGAVVQQLPAPFRAVQSQWRVARMWCLVEATSVVVNFRCRIVHRRIRPPLRVLKQ